MWRYFLAAFVALLYGCAGLSGVDIYVNKQYQGKPKPVAKLAIIPLTQLGDVVNPQRQTISLEKVTNDYFEKSFKDVAGKVSLVPMSKSGEAVRANPDLFAKILAIKYSERELNGNPGLQGTLDKKELALLRGQLDNAELLLVPARFALDPTSARIFGYSEFRLYDLDSGSLVYSGSRNINVDRVDGAGKGLTAIVLVGEASKDFKKLYLKQ